MIAFHETSGHPDTYDKSFSQKRRGPDLHARTFTQDEIQAMSKRAINKYHRSIDDSKLWPICGKFNATERAIRRVRRFQAQIGTPIEGLEYWLALESELSNIVNGAI